MRTRGHDDAFWRGAGLPRTTRLNQDGKRADARTDRHATGIGAGERTASLAWPRPDSLPDYRVPQAVIMRPPLEIGTACAQPGQIVFGELEAVELPSGGDDSFPIILAQGTHDGPVLWLTASIHGAEYTGIPVIHQLITPELVSKLRGTIVAVPTLNPSGLRTAQRSGYYMGGQDPNRLFPAPPSRRRASASTMPPTAIEAAYQRLFDHIRSSANYLIDMHNYSIGALSFTFRDPVYYRNGRDKAAAQQLYDTTGEMLSAFGHTIINEFASSEYLKLNLHRSVSGAALNAGHIPAFTAELGGYMTVDQDIVKAAVTGIRNVLRWAGMLDGAPEPI